jgi:hypothetical protein
VADGSDSEAILDRVLQKYQRYTGKSMDGDAATLEDALRDAYKKGEKDGHKLFRVEEIFIAGDNPLSGYAVVITPHG